MSNCINRSENNNVKEQWHAQSEGLIVLTMTPCVYWMKIPLFYLNFNDYENHLFDVLRENW